MTCYGRALGALLAAVCCVGEPLATLAQNGGFIERTQAGRVVEPPRTSSARSRVRNVRRRPTRAVRRGAPSRGEALAGAGTRPVDGEALKRRPTADAIRIAGKQAVGEVKPIVFVEMDDTSIFQVVLAVGRLTQINLNGKVDHVAFSDFERFRFDYKDGMLFVSPGTKDAALVDWRKVRTDLAVVLADGRQCHFECVVVDATQPSHRVINVNAPPPRRDLTEEEVASRAEAARRVAEARAAEDARKRDELIRMRDEVLARAATQPLTGRARRGPLEIAVGGPLEIEGRAYVRIAVTNRGKQPLPLTVSLGTSAGQSVPIGLSLPSAAVAPKETVLGLVEFAPASVPVGVSLALVVTAPGLKPVEYRFERQTR
jgi:hypothetical protein